MVAIVSASLHGIASFFSDVTIIFNPSIYCNHPPKVFVENFAGFMAPVAPPTVLMQPVTPVRSYNDSSAGSADS